jgi:hypothetical protein
MKTDVGYYSVAGKHYSNKFEAILAAQQNHGEVKWHFFEEVFSKVNWHTEPSQSLDELYRLRAQQIRDKYDYIIVFCSGGADSNNVIRTFINNNIHVDEVMGIAPMSALHNWNFDDKNISESNTISETKFALLPLLNEVTLKCPRTKVTLHDYFEKMKGYKDEQWVYDGAGNINTVLTSHFTDVLSFKHIDDIVQQGKRVGLVFGSDKPVIRISFDHSMHFLFADAAINYLNTPSHREHPSVDRVLFYTSADLPEMLVKQSHVTARAILLPENKFIADSLRIAEKQTVLGITSLQHRIDYEEKQNSLYVSSKADLFNYYMNRLRAPARIDNRVSSKTLYQRMIVPYIYPSTYTKDLFQCQKVDSDAGFFTRDQAWVHELHKNTRMSDMIISGTKSLYDSISPKYLNMNGSGFVNFFNSYKFGTIGNFSPLTHAS